MLDLQWPNGLLAGITHLLERSDDPHYCHDENMRANKLAILVHAYAPFRQGKSQPGASLHALSAKEQDEFKFQGKLYPDYFDHSFSPKPTSTDRPGWPYTYDDVAGVTSFWVDFADTRLGGGVFGNGFLQEETMCCEIPELADAAGLRWFDPDKYTLYTRDKDDFPSPLVLREALRTFDVGKTGITKDTIVQRMFGPDAITKGDTMPHPVNVLAMATREVSTTDALTEKVIYDLFNTFVAGFTLARDNAGTKTRVNSGPIGTGDFKNNVYLVYILQVLAARYVGVDNVVLFGYEGQKGDTSEALLNSLDQGFKSITDKTVLNLLKLIPKLNIPPNP